MLDAFRFHTGSIKSSYETYSDEADIDGFDSILVRLKVDGVILPNEDAGVSIPYWFD